MTDWLDGGDPGNRGREGIDRGYETNPPPSLRWFAVKLRSLVAALVGARGTNGQ